MEPRTFDKIPQCTLLLLCAYSVACAEPPQSSQLDKPASPPAAEANAVVEPPKPSVEIKPEARAERVPTAGASAPPPQPPAATTKRPVEKAAASSETPPQLAAAYYGPAFSQSPIEPRCQGFALDGLRYSPGGSVLPNRCAPFHATTNNPYAVRCIDVYSHYKTEFPGDSSCILPPPPELGAQLGVHPQGSSWLDAIATGDLSAYTQATDEWRMQPGEEETVNYRTTVQHEAAGHYYRIYYRMRSGSHHMIITVHDDATSKRDVWFPSAGLPGQFDPTLGTLLTTIGTAQRPDDNSPQALDKPVEDEGLYNELPSGAAIIFNMHHFNSFDRPLLKEAWVNVFWEDNAHTPISPFGAIPLDQVLGLSIPAGKTVDLHYAWTLEDPLRLLRVFAHRHAWTPNFSVWIVRAGHTEPQPIYRSFDWSDVLTYRFDSLTMNPMLDPDARMDGGASGVIHLEKGDQLHFSCHITFTDERA